MERSEPNIFERPFRGDRVLTTPVRPQPPVPQHLQLSDPAADAAKALAEKKRLAEQGQAMRRAMRANR